MPRTSLLLLIAFVLSQTNYCFAQTNLRFTHYTTREGLSNNIVFSLFQDSRGLLWVGTSNGVNFFDGVSFQAVYPTDFDPVHLHSDEVAQIAEDAEGNILLTTKDGVEEYNWQTKMLRLVFPASMNEHVCQFMIDKQKNVWLLSEQYLQEYNPQLRLLRSIRLDTLKQKIGNIGGFSVTFLSIDNAGNIWFSYHDVVCKWNVSNYILESKYNNFYHKQIFEVNSSAIVQDKRGYYWFILKHKHPPDELARYDWDTDSLCIYHSKSNLITQIVISASGKMWINSYGSGLITFDTLHHSFQTIHSNVADVNTPSDNIFTQLYEDKYRNIWLASNYGLDKCTDLSNNFTVLNKFGYEDPQTHFDKAVVDGITAYKSNLFVCTTGGLFKENTNNFHQTYFRYDKKKPSPEDYYWISLNIDNTSLLASTLEGVFLYKLNDEKLQPVSLPFKHPALLDSVATVAAFKDSKQNIWLGMFGGAGVYRWNKTTNAYTKYDAQQTGKDYFPLRHFSCAAEDDDGNIWMGYDKGGMAVFNSARQKFVQPSFAAFTLLKNNVIHDILNDHHGNLWISTAEGLFCYSIQTKQLKQYSRVDGLISNNVTGMAFDKKGVLWMGNYSGLSRLDTATKQFTNFTVADGLPADEIDRMIYDSAINKICFTTPYTIVLFDPYLLKKSNPVLCPIITSLYVMGKQRSVSNSNAIHLSSDENYFSFNYTAPNFTNAADVRYEYKLKGFNTAWINAGKRQYAGYTNLNGGNYVFKVRASTDGIRWDEMAAPVSIHVATPFIKTVWFYLLLSLSVSAIVFLFIYSGYRARLKRIVTALKIRNEIASDLHDDVGSSLSSIMLMSELAKKRQTDTTTDFDKIKENAGKIIESMNDIVWAVNPNNDTMEQLLVRMQSFAASLLEKKDIIFQFIAEEGLTAIKLNTEERKNFYLIFKEAIHNAFKYADCSHVVASISSSHRLIIMSICDDGKGFDADQRYMGNGLENMKKRAKEIKGKLDISSSPNNGATVTLVFKPTHKGG